MLYYTPMAGTKEKLRAVPYTRCWPDTAESIEAMSIWINDYMSFGDAIRENRWSLYQFSAPQPTAFPISGMNLNCVDSREGEPIGDQLNPTDYKEAIAWISKFDNETICNSQYEGDGSAIAHLSHLWPVDKPGRWTKGRATGAELRKVLCDITRSTGDIVWSPNDQHPEMRFQTFVYIPVKMYRVSLESIINPDAKADFNNPNAKVVRKIRPQDIADEMEEDI